MTNTSSAREVLRVAGKLGSLTVIVKAGRYFVWQLLRLKGLHKTAKSKYLKTHSCKFGAICLWIHNLLEMGQQSANSRTRRVYQRPLPNTPWWWYNPPPFLVHRSPPRYGTTCQTPLPMHWEPTVGGLLFLAIYSSPKHCCKAKAKSSRENPVRFLFTFWSYVVW